MKENVLLVSLWGNYNYGNKLQSFALKTIIQEMGYSVTVVKHDEPKLRLKTRVKKTVHMLIGRKEIVEPRSIIREKYFEDFTREYVDEEIMVENFDANHINPNSYYAAVVGSDQVWHNFFNRKSELEFFFLKFMPEEKRISYAASFGFECFPKKYKKVYKDGLRGIKFCSCREKIGCELVEKAIGRQVPQVLDPTLCLSADEWSKIEKKPLYNVAKEYILVYFIAGKSDEYKEYIQDLMKEHNIECLDIYDGDNRFFYTTGPKEFIWLIKNAKFICTDSFHASVFSILFRKQFLVFPRCNEEGTGSYGRIDALLNLCSLTNCEYRKTITPFCISDEMFDIASEKISIEKEVSFEFLKNALQKVQVDVSKERTNDRK